ncbi:MAG: PCMD domain-containing protein, partial [Tannerellaceae bacterium]|nr:PCMD domain-containing protein [Tannerellaceae bacterium]
MKACLPYSKLKAFLPVAVLAICVSCIQKEPLNPEADILSFALPGDVALTDAVLNRNDISITVRKNADLTSIVPIIEITPGATISPAPGTPCDLTRAVTYTVTSENRSSVKTYTVTAIAYSLFHFDFEHWDETATDSYRYETPVEYNAENERVVYWASGNRGVSMYLQYSDPALYPVHKTTVSVSGGYAAEMVTQKGPGKIFNRNISVVAGSLFTGSFNLLSAMINPLTATRFGQSCDAKPVRFTGYYKYKAGDGDYIAPNGDVLPGVKDSCSVYSVF